MKFESVKWTVGVVVPVDTPSHGTGSTWSVDRCNAELRKRLSEEWALSEPGSLVDRYCVKNDLVSKSLGVQTDLVSELICFQTTWCPDNLKTLCLTDLVTWCPNHLVSK